MRDSLVARGVSPEVIILDGKGFRTLDSVVRAANVFGVKSFTVVSQKFIMKEVYILLSIWGWTSMM